MLLTAEQIHMDFGAKKLLDDVSLYLGDHDKIGFVGVNGTGKSTLLKLLAGRALPDSGKISVSSGARISYLAQDPVMDPDATVLDAVFAGVSAEVRINAEFEGRAMLNKLGIFDHAARIRTLSGGQKKRVALSGALMRPCEILILDEPTNHLDSETVIWLEDRLKRFAGGVLMVTHDRYFLENVVNRIAELAHGKLHFYEANYSRYLQLSAERSELLLASERKRQSILRREYEWISRGARARGTKSRERIERYQALLSRDAPEDDPTVAITATAGRMGKKLIALEHVSKSFDGNRVLDDFTYHVKRDDRIGVVGKNGAGKTTLLKLVAGALQPDTGTVETGATVRIGYFAQENQALDPNLRVYDYIRSIAAEVETAEGTLSAAQLLEQFLFDGTMQYGKIGLLSGGERRRLYLLGVLAAAPNILLLDEPTNDLDVETLAILESYLESFPGAVIAVSHDRFFLDRMASEIFALDGGGTIARYTGNFSDYLAKRPDPAPLKAEPAPVQKRPLPSASAKPAKKKMTFNEQREYGCIDDDIAALEVQIDACKRARDASASDYVRVLAHTEELQKLELQLEEKTARWVYLNDLADEIEAQNAAAGKPSTQLEEHPE